MEARKFLSDDELFALAERGASLQFMATKARTDILSIARRLRALEFDTTHCPYRLHHYENTEMRKSLRAWYEAGESIPSIMNALKLAYPVVRRMLELAGTQFRLEVRRMRS